MNTPEPNAARWKQFDELLDAVLELPADQRPAFLDRACNGDESLRKEIDRMLAHEEQLGSFIQTPAFYESAADADTSNLVALLKGESAGQPLLRVGSLVAGRYQILSRIGKGGMGEVWRALDLKLRIDVALKSIRLDLQGRQEDLVDLIRREVRTAREVISPNVCRIFDLVTEEDQELISMEYIDGITLLQAMEQGPLDLREARDIAAQFLAGLEAIHLAGLVHRDLKPENLMITRTGRVVVMDLGIAEHVAQTGNAVSGTLPYMSPEQMAGDKIDARSDIFSAGVVLAEMIHTKGTDSKTTRENIWNAVRKDPMTLPDSPWKLVITRAVSGNRENRFESASSLSRALEDITLRAEADEIQTPYPGLASFQKTDAEYFFGREQEVETLIKKLQQQNLAALIGSSGAGKTSLLQAGLIPVLPKDWCCALTSPGDAPFINFQRGLTPLISKDDEVNATEQFENTQIMIRVLSNLRKSHKEFVLIVDRFEELFTLNSFTVQSRFAEFLGHAAMEADIRILLSMRDDFLIFCKEHASLAPIFSDLTAMLPLSGVALRRALVQPALKCGYRFEDETLVDDILRDVEKERGALPLLAFAASLLWEKRDREKGVLTREAYVRIGGVQGGLARHAEIMMAQLGSDKEPVVREIFRNLITAQHTRVARDTDELLSVFPDQQAAEAVLKTLIDARLLTSFESARCEGARRRIEISHESLITNWPRLVKWRSQESESAQLRDQLRQAANLWGERGHSQDLLWTGASFLEFQLWRQRYPGGLTNTEEAFARAMTHYANRKRKQRRITIVAIFVILLFILGVIGNLWRKASMARDDALLQATRAQAGVVLNVGRAIPDSDPTTKLAYAIASLELADTPQARRFALQGLSEGPTAHVIEIGNNASIELSPDNKWIAAARINGAVDLIPLDGAKSVQVQPSYREGNYIPWSSQFSPDGNLLLWTWREHPEVVKVWSLAQSKVLRTFELEGLTKCLVRGDTAYFITDLTGRKDAPFGWADSVIRTWKFDFKEPEVLGRVNRLDNSWKNLDIDPHGRWMSYTNTRGVCVRPLNKWGIGPEKQIGNDPPAFVRFVPDGERIAYSDSTGIKIRSLLQESTIPDHTITGPVNRIWFDPKSSFAYGIGEDHIAEWDLSIPSALPVLYRSPGGVPKSIIFDSQNRWMAIGAGTTLAFHPRRRMHPYILHSTGSASSSRFTSDGRFLLTASAMDGIRLWSLPAESGSPPRTLWNDKIYNATSIDIDESGKNVLAATNGDGVHSISILDGKDTVLKDSRSKEYSSAVFSIDGKFAAASGNTGMQIWDLQSGGSRIIEKSKGIYFPRLAFSSDGSLISGDVAGKLYRWNLDNDMPKIWSQGNGSVLIDMALSQDGRYMAVVRAQEPISTLVLYDLKTDRSLPITAHGNHVVSATFDPGGINVITGDSDGIVRVGSIQGDTPHLLLGHKSSVDSVAVHPGGEWIASNEFKSVVRLWRMPHGKPLESLPYTEFLNYLRAQTNVRPIADKDSPTGYRLQFQPFSISAWRR